MNQSAFNSLLSFENSSSLSDRLIAIFKRGGFDKRRRSARGDSSQEERDSNTESTLPVIDSGKTVGTSEGLMPGVKGLI